MNQANMNITQGILCGRDKMTALSISPVLKHGISRRSKFHVDISLLHFCVTGPTDSSMTKLKMPMNSFFNKRCRMRVLSLRDKTE